MILLTKLDKSKILVSLESVKYIEATPDTLIFFNNGDSTIVFESLEEITRLVVEFKVEVLKKTKELSPATPSH